MKYLFGVFITISICTIIMGTTFSIVDVHRSYYSEDVKFYVEKNLSERGFSIVDRSNIYQLVEEWSYQNYNLSRDDWYRQELELVDYIVIIERVEGSGRRSDRIKLRLSDNVSVYVYTYTFSSSARIKIMDMNNRVVSHKVVRAVGISAYIDRVVSSNNNIDNATLNEMVRIGLLATGIGAVIADQNSAVTAAQDASFSSLGNLIANRAVVDEDYYDSSNSNYSDYDSADMLSRLLLIAGLIFLLYVLFGSDM